MNPMGMVGRVNKEDCYTHYIKAPGLMVSDRKILYVFIIVSISVYGSLKKLQFVEFILILELSSKPLQYCHGILL